MTLQTPTRRSAAISDTWDDDDRLVSATHDLHNGVANAASELVGHLLQVDDPRESEEKWIGEVIEAVEMAGVSAARPAMIDKLSELIDDAPATLVDYPASDKLRELRALDR